MDFITVVEIFSGWFLWNCNIKKETTQTTASKVFLVLTLWSFRFIAIYLWYHSAIRFTVAVVEKIQ